MKPASLLGETALDAFFDEVFERTVHHAIGGASGWAELMSVDAVMSLATGDDARFPDVALASGDRSVPPRTYSRRRRIDADAVRREVADGATVVLKHVGRRVPELADALRTLGRDLGGRIAANAYLSPPHASGFEPHWDTHDVFAVQISGSKVWHLYETREPQPLARFRDADRDTGPVVESITLRAGDCLYVPAGFVHSARATDEPSLHLALGFYPMRVLDAAVEAVAARALGDAQLRRALQVQRSDDTLVDVLADVLRDVANDRGALVRALTSARAELARKRGERPSDPDVLGPSRTSGS